MTTDIRRAGRVLGTAFLADPLFVWALPNESRRTRALPRIFTGSLRHCHAHGGIVDLAGGAAVACWARPGHASVSIGDAVRSGLVAAPIWLGPRGAARLQRHEGPVDRRMATHLGPDDAYLMAVGTATEARGTGLGRECVEAVREQAAAAGHHSVVLRTENPANVPLYEHLGFDVIDHWRAAASDLDVWAFRQATR